MKMNCEQIEAQAMKAYFRRFGNDPGFMQPNTALTQINEVDGRKVVTLCGGDYVLAQYRVR